MKPYKTTNKKNLYFNRFLINASKEMASTVYSLTGPIYKL